ncbi:MAG: hypothetical protein GX640_07465 [Fibrobacter sp.]|nr:hypothetical protein [Fibrobacter sp.]
MRIHKNLLDKNNPLKIGDITLGERIAFSGKNYLWESRAGSTLDVIVIHYISAALMDSKEPFKLDSILNIFPEYGVSSHYLITRRGKIMMLVPEEHKAWHCGGSIMPEPDNRKAVNDFSIGIELMATETSGFTAAQYASLAALCSDIEKRYKRKFTYVGHDMIAGGRAVELGLRTTVKVDPGPEFKWEQFYDLMKKNRVQKLA